MIPSERRPTRVAVSAIAELLWVLHRPAPGDQRLLPTLPPPEVMALLAAPPSLEPEIGAFWDDGATIWLELVVLGQQTGTLADPDPAAFLAGLDPAAATSPARRSCARCSSRPCSAASWSWSPAPSPGPPATSSTCPGSSGWG